MYFNLKLDGPGVGKKRSSTGYRVGFAPNWGRNVIEADDLRPTAPETLSRKTQDVLSDIADRLDAMKPLGPDQLASAVAASPARAQ